MNSDLAQYGSQLPTHPYTGLRALGLTKRGTPIWPVLGGSQPFGQPAGPQVPVQSGGNTPGIPTLGGGHVQPNQAQGMPQPGGAPQQQPGGQPQGQQPGQTGGQPQGQQQQVPAGQLPFSGGHQQGQQASQPGGQQQAPVPAPPPVFNPPPGERGFPENTPVEQMTEPQQVAFWRYHARRNQDQLRQQADYEQLRQERDQLRAATQTEMQRAAAEAEQRGRQAGMEAASAQIVEAYFRAAAAGRMSESAIEAQLATLNRAAFVQAGQVSQQQVYDHVNLIVGGQPAPQGQQAYGNGGFLPPGQQPVFVPSAVGYAQQLVPGAQGGYGAPAPAPYGQPGYPQPQPQPQPQQGQGQGQWQPGYGQVPNAAAFGHPQQQGPGFGQAQQQQTVPGGWPQFAPVAQQPQGWAAPGMPAYGQQVMRQVPDYGQGAQPAAPQAAPEAGRQRAAERHGTTRSAQKSGNAAVNGGRPGR